MSTVFVGDVGTVITLDCGINISTATLVKIRAKKPDLSVVEWAATVEGTNSITHTITVGELNVPGVWLLQSYVEMPEWRGRGEWVSLTVAT